MHRTAQTHRPHCNKREQHTAAIRELIPAQRSSIGYLWVIFPAFCLLLQVTRRLPIPAHLRLVQQSYILWRGSMVTPVGTPDLGAIVLPIPIPLLYLGSLATMDRNQACYRRESRTFTSADGRIERQRERESFMDLQTG